MKNVRRLTIYNHYNVPRIMIQGKWLAKAGFKAKDKIKVVVSGNTIVITKTRKR